MSAIYFVVGRYASIADYVRRCATESLILPQLKTGSEASREGGKAVRRFTSSEAELASSENANGLLTIFSLHDWKSFRLSLNKQKPDNINEGRLIGKRWPSMLEFNDNLNSIALDCEAQIAVDFFQRDERIVAIELNVKTFIITESITFSGRRTACLQ